MDVMQNYQCFSREECADDQTIKHQFNPYAMHGGTVLGIAGDDFALLASDTRLSEGFIIHTREQSKLYKINDKTVLACCGFHGDVQMFTTLLQFQVKKYHQTHKRPISVEALAQRLANMLYYRRFFPYYVSNILGGLDSEGKGAIYSYDPVGSFEREQYRAGGSSSAIVQPLLDNQIGGKNQEGITKEPITKEKAIMLAKDAFISAAERDINTGDAIVISIITKDGITEERFELRKD